MDGCINDTMEAIESQWVLKGICINFGLSVRMNARMDVADRRRDARARKNSSFTQ